MILESATDVSRSFEPRSAVRLWWTWTLSCSAGEFLGMAVAAGFAALSTLLFGEPETFPSRMAVLLAMVLAGVLEGSSIGYFQWRVVHQVFPALSPRAWLTPTIIVAAVGWLVGMLPPTFFGSGQGGESVAEPSRLIITLFAVTFGGLAGALFGFAQWLVLRRHTQGATVWIWVNAIGWALAMSVIYFGASLPTFQWPITAVVLDGALTGVVAGLVIGSVTGIGLVWLLKDRYGWLA